MLYNIMILACVAKGARLCHVLARTPFCWTPLRTPFI